MGCNYQKLVLICSWFVMCQHAFAQLPDFKKADSVAELYAGHSLKDLELLSCRLTENFSTDKEKFRAIYKWVCKNIDNDYALAEKNLSQRRILTGSELDKWNRDFSLRTMKVLFSHNRTVCTGYAWLVRELSRYAGINCAIINGYGRNSKSNVGGVPFANHSWNAVQLDHKWYLCDPTWSSGAVNTTTNTFIENFEESYFLADPELFVRNHFPLDTTWTLLKNPPSLHEFMTAPVIYVNSFKYQVVPVSPANFNVAASKGERVSFTFERKSKEPILLVIGTSLVSSENDNRVDYTFNRRGTFPVHFLVDYKYVASYEVTVR